MEINLTSFEVGTLLAVLKKAGESDHEVKAIEQYIRKQIYGRQI